jgi:hypothetical protein
MATPVSDYRSNPNEHIVHAVNVLKRAPRRARIFLEIYRSQKRAKTAEEIANALGVTTVAVLQDGGRLYNEQLVTQIKIDGKIAYGKERIYVTNKSKIVRYQKNPENLKKLPTKQHPKISSIVSVIRIPGRKVLASAITCDDIFEFSRVKKFKSAPKRTISENAFKQGIKTVVGESGSFKDWGEEKNDLFSKVRVGGARRLTAFAFKGPGTSGILTPGKLGKNGDQIQRLFESAAEVFLIQYHGQIAESVVQQMQAFAEIKSIREQKRVWYGIIDGDDTNRLLAAYPNSF